MALLQSDIDANPTVSRSSRHPSSHCNAGTGAAITKPTPAAATDAAYVQLRALHEDQDRCHCSTRKQQLNGADQPPNSMIILLKKGRTQSGCGRVIPVSAMMLDLPVCPG